MILRARWVLDPEGRAFDGGIEIESGRIRRLHEGAAACRRAGGRVVDLGDGLLAPGFVNAHAHLELGRLAGRIDAGSSFVDWVEMLVRERGRLTPEDFVIAVEEGARRLVETGTTTVGDIASIPDAARTRRGVLRSVVYREVLDAADPERSERALATVRRSLPRRRLRTEGLSPHAPYSVSAKLLEGVGALLARRPMPVTVHWAETRGEADWMLQGVGEWAPILGPSPRCSGLDHLDRAGLLHARTSLVHGNHPGPGETERLAAAGITLVHCPGSHAFFSRPTFELAAYRSAGVRLALGTDSLASNTDLDMAREVALFRDAHPALSPFEVFRMATEGGAAALGLDSLVGTIRPGKVADLAFHRVEGPDPLDAITSGQGEVTGVWVEGRRVFRRL